MPVFAIALPKDHEVLDVESLAEAWTPAPAAALLFYVERLATPVQSRLRILAPTYRRDYCFAAAGTHWINHCQRCGSVQQEHELHCEPDAPFVPTTAQAAAAIHVIEVRDAFAAAAAGYAYAAPSLDAARRV